MTVADRIAYQQGVEDAIRAAGEAVEGYTRAEDGSISYAAITDMFAAMRRRLPAKAAYIKMSEPIDYFAQLKSVAHRAWFEKHGHGTKLSGVEHDAVAGVDTPLGRLKAIVWRRPWAGKRGERLCWAAEYYLDDEPVTIAEITAAGLADKKFRRNRGKR